MWKSVFPGSLDPIVYNNALQGFSNSQSVKGWQNEGIGSGGLDAKFFALKLGYKEGVSAGIDSTIGFFESLGTKEGWMNLGEGLMNTGKSFNNFMMAGLTSDSRAFYSQAANGVGNYVTNLSNMSAYEIGYDFGYGTEKILEAVVLSKGVGFSTNASRNVLTHGIKGSTANFVFKNSSLFNNNNWFRLGKGWNPNIRAKNMRAAWGAHPNHIDRVPRYLRSFNERLRNWMGGHKHFPRWWRD